ncbi:hypothetical protein OROGR_005535 [Orobanche gracilis]
MPPGTRVPTEAERVTERGAANLSELQETLLARRRKAKGKKKTPVRKEKSAALKEAIDDLEWPGSSIQIKLQPSPPAVIFRGEGHGDLQYKYKFLRATTSNIPGSVIRDNRGSKLTIGRGGMLKVQHLVSVAKPTNPHPHIDSAGYQQPSRIAYIEFFVKPEVEEEDNAHD